MSNQSGKTRVDAGDNNEMQSQQEADTTTKDKERALSPSATTIPRLITVAEIIKREYLIAMDAKRAPDLMGLYQYNEMGCIEDGIESETVEEKDEERMKMLAEVLAGKK